jgi:AcrR family transcriptional regulator
MSPRPLTVSDAALLDGAARVISRIGILRLTLADVAAELHISPGTLVHRFGSKRALLLSLLRRSVARSVERGAAGRVAGRSPVAALLALATRAARHVQTREALAHDLTFLQSNLADPAFHRLAVARARALRREIRTLVRHAIAAGELARCDPERLARAIQAAINGSLLQWAIEGRGTLATWIRRNIATILAPLARGGARRSR